VVCSSSVVLACILVLELSKSDEFPIKSYNFKRSSPIIRKKRSEIPVGMSTREDPPEGLEASGRYLAV